MKNIYYLYSRIGGSNYPPTRETRTPFRHSFCSGFINKLEMKEIQLTRGYVALVDDEDYDYLMQWKWCAHGKGRFIYAERSQKIKKTRRSKTIEMHRIILNTPDGMQVDHIDHNTLNNQKSNLRNCTKSENMRNRVGFGVSKYVGVAFDKDPKRRKNYIAQIKVNDKRIHLGRFINEKDAAIRFDKAALFYYGEFANLNFPELKEQYLAELSVSL